MNRAYNKEAINKVASEDRLDKMIILATPGIWFSVLGAFLVVGALLIWGFLGSLDTTVEANGIFTNSDGTLEVYAKDDGFILNVYAKEGDAVSEGDIIATVGTEDDIFELKQIDTRIQYVENMTFDSEYDSVTTDTQEMAAIKLSAKGNGQDLEKQKSELEMKQEKLTELSTYVKGKEDVMLTYKERYFSSLNISNEMPQIKYNEANTDYDKHFTLYEQARNTYISAKEKYYSMRDSFDAKYSNYDTTTHTSAENDAYMAALKDVENARSEATDYEEFMKKEQSKLSEATSTLDRATKEYVEYMNSLSEVQAQNTVAYTEYNEALSEYNSAKTQYRTLSDEVDELRLQVLLQEGIVDGDIESYKLQFDNAKSAKLIDLQAQRDSILNSASQGELRSSVNGKIYDINLYPGMAVSKGTKIASLLAGDLQNSEIICYVPLKDVKKIRSGMEVFVYPSTVKKEEYGHIYGTVTKVGGHVETEQDMDVQLGSDSLVADFSKNGPVVEMRCALAKDESTVSGFEWSSERGSVVPLETGTVISLRVITDSKRPIDLFIPYLRDRANFETDADEQGE